MHIEAVTDPLKSSEICDTILRSLPEWFAVEASAEEYAEAVRGLPFFAACQGNRQRWALPPFGRTIPIPLKFSSWACSLNITVRASAAG